MSREDFLAAVRAAVVAGNRAGHAPARPERGGVGYQGAGPDPVARFRDELTAAGGQFHRVAGPAEAADTVLALAHARGVQRVLLGRESVLESLRLAAAFRASGVQCLRVDTLSDETARDAFFAADLGVSGVDYLIAETGSMIFRSRPDQPRSLSLLPPIHIAVARRDQLLADLFDLFEVCGDPPSCLTVITGPSKTGDIELRLVTGVHGPGEVHVVLLDALTS
jgi:L-lactate utilization protein LutC